MHSGQRQARSAAEFLRRKKLGSLSFSILTGLAAHSTLPLGTFAFAAAITDLPKKAIPSGGEGVFYSFHLLPFPK